MSIGLIALLDDVAAIAKVAAASLDDVAAQAAKAGAKAAGVVIDDAAVTPRYVTGFTADRELPIIGKIAAGSLKNKLIILLPAALLLSFVAPFLITPLLMIGGIYLAYEGTEKVFEAIVPHSAHAHEAEIGTVAVSASTMEDEKVASAIKTDFILSAEIMAITLAAVPEDAGFWMEAVVLAVVGIGITLAVYGAVALIVKADDLGIALAASRGGPLVRGFGRGLVKAMPALLKGLAVIGTAAMVWVGGGIVLHGLEEFGIAGPAHLVHDAALAVGHAVPEQIAGLTEWLVSAALSGIVGLIVGAVTIPVAGKILGPAWRGMKTAVGRG